MNTRKRALASLDLEMKQHIEDATREHLARGLSQEEARRAALREFGNITHAKEDTRAVWIPVWLDQMLQDIRYGLRLLRRYPGFTTVTILTLALAIGANTAIFTVVNQVLLNPPGISHPERLVSIRVDSKNYKDVNVSAPVFADIRDSRQIFEHAAAEDFVSLNYSEGPDPLRLSAAAVTSEWFDVFGAKPIAGRVFVAEEDKPGAARVAVLAHATWVQLFGSDPKVIGRTVELSQQFYKIIGVMDASFEWPKQVALWVPLALPPEAFAPKRREGGTLHVIARMLPKARFQQAALWVEILTERAANQGTPDSLLLKNLGWAMVARRFVEESAGGTQKALLVLLASVGLVLLSACLNIAGLLLARSSSRAHELAMRAALGADRLRIIRQMLSESLLLAATGGLLGLLLAQGLTTLLLKIAPEELSIGVHASPDGYVLVFTFSVALLSGLVCGILPAVQMSKPESVRTGGTRASTGGPNGQRQLSTLVILETALSVVLLVGAGLLLRTLNALERVNPGFDSHGVLTAMFSLPPARYSDGIKQAAFYRTVLDRLTHSGGVASAGIGVGIPFNNWIWGIGFAVEGEQRTPGEPLHEGIRQWVTPGFFGTLKIPLKWGRYLSDDDRMGGPSVAVIDETLAHQFWSAEIPPRSRISLADDRELIPVVGVVPHVSTVDLTGDKGLGGLGTVYFSLFQRKEQFPFPPVGWIVARTTGDPYTLTATIRDAVRQADKNLPVADIKSLDDLIAYTLTPRRFVMHMLESFAITAIFMAGLGLYGVISFSITRRTREIGIRLALGASPNRVRRTVILEGMSLSVIGTGIGLMAAYSLAGQLTSLLYDTSIHDPITFITVPIFSLLLTFVACFIPAQRASRTRPANALRWE